MIRKFSVEISYEVEFMNFDMIPELYHYSARGCSCQSSEPLCQDWFRVRGRSKDSILFQLHIALFHSFAAFPLRISILLTQCIGTVIGIKPLNKKGPFQNPIHTDEDSISSAEFPAVCVLLDYRAAGKTIVSVSMIVWLIIRLYRVHVL